MNGAFTSSSMNQMAYAGMIGSPSYSERFAQRAATSTFNTAGAVGGPAASLGLAFAGLDPFSLAIKGGMAGYGMGGVAGGIAGGVAGAAFAGAPVMAASYGVGQMFQGAQQQQALGGMLNANFQQRNQAGGSGFGNFGNAQIGSGMRQMTTQQGPMGEMVGFEELGRLAQGMARMGMAQGVRDAKEFGEKFRTMVSTLKEIATNMGTSLEEAQKMMAGMKSAGIFRQADQAKFSAQIRTGALTGGMATSEVTGMMSVGSQISRMMGGTGKAGAQGGLETITNIGAAQQGGFLSEEAIYNATGLTGAEGRRALATQQMQSAAKFLQGGLGRRLIASMAGKNGQLNEGAASAFASGTQGTEETMKRAYENLSGVGRANFIRNEGRLRGEVLARFGGNTQAMALQGWLSERGLNMDTTDDRTMLFAQRRLGMGRDEMDAAVQTLKAMPFIAQQKATTAEREQGATRDRARNANSGVIQYKRMVDRGIATLNAELQESGAKIETVYQNTVERFIKYITDERTTEYREDVKRALDTGKLGGATGRGALATAFGGGMASWTSKIGGAGALSAGMNASDFVKEFGKADRDSLASAGYNIQSSSSRKGIQAGLSQAQNIASIMRGQGTSISMTAGAVDAVRDAFGNVTGSGNARMESIQSALNNINGNKEVQALAARIRDAKSPGERAMLIRGIATAAGVKGEEKMFDVPDLKGSYGARAINLESDQLDELGKQMFGSTSVIEGGIISTSRQMKASLGFQNRLLKMVGLGGNLFDSTSMTAEARTAAAAYFKTDAGRGIATQALSANRDTRQQAVTNIQDQLKELRDQQTLAAGGKGVFTTAQEGKMEFLRSAEAAAKLTEIGGDGASPQAIEQMAARLGMKKDEFLDRARGVAGGVKGMQSAAYKQAKESMQRSSSEAVERMSGAGGLLKRNAQGGLDLVKMNFSTAAGGGAAAAIVQGFVEREKSMAEGGSIEEYYGKNKGLLAGQAGLSVSQKRALARELEGKAGGEELAANLRSQAGIQQFLTKGRKGSAAGNIANLLGADISSKDLSALDKSGGIDALVNAISSSAGLKSEDSKKDLRAALEQARGKDFGTAAQRVMAIQQGEGMDLRKKKLESQQDPVQREMANSMKTVADAFGPQGYMSRTAVRQTNSLAAIENKLVGDKAEKNG